MKAVGGNARDLKVVVFKGSAEAIPALLGGHIELGVFGAVNVVPHVSSGRMRILGVAAPQRLSGPLATAPTWRELGVNVVTGSWRGVFAPKNLTAPQVTERTEPGSDPEQMYESLQRLAALPPDTIVFPGHRYSMPSSASMEAIRESNYVFRPRSKDQWMMMFGHD